MLSKVSLCHITLSGSFPACHFFSGRRIISPRQMQRGRNTRLFAMQFIKTCFRGGLREHWLEMLIIIFDNVLTCLLPYPAASGSWRGARAGISVCFSPAFPHPPTLRTASPAPSRIRYRGQREEKLFACGKAACGWGRQRKRSFYFSFLYFNFFFWTR